MLDQPTDQLNQFMDARAWVVARGVSATAQCFVSNGSVFRVACFATFADRGCARATRSLTQWLMVEQLVHKSSWRAGACQRG
jgi:hypothetical protein